ncbi:MAG: sulfotransferase [Pseudomonadota bacterium]
MTLARSARDTASTPPDLDTLGSVLSACGDLPAAHLCFERAARVAPDTAHFIFNHATSLRAMGDMAAAETAFERVLDLKPDDWDAHLAISTLRSQTMDANHLSRLQAAVARAGSDPIAQVKLQYALAKEYEDIGEHASAFDHLSSGADLRRRHSNYQVENDVAAMASIREVFNEDLLSKANAGCESAEPIFILGLPRTGSTLCETILASHSEVQSCGELQQFAVELVQLARNKAIGQGKQDLIRQSPNLPMQTLGQNYVDATRPLTGSRAHFIDKMPLNFLYIGLISMALPNARIIHLRRHPMDACYAIYKTYFQQTYPYSYNLEDLGRYYLAYDELMAHWEQVLPGKIIHVDYEALVSDTEATTRGLLKRCNLEWQPQCLEFQRANVPTATASASQVRQRVSTGSVGKWRNYRTQLEPLAQILQSAGIEVG